ncbi:hypothetical protein AB4114_20325 [Paenibacillus sp. 2RAB27]|uniref:hypothetical protein n=1 Tax=Paenibacillus sp. 2RAB27 TaxID=3232991 RepID=UPI003F9C3B77
MVAGRTKSTNTCLKHARGMQIIRTAAPIYSGSIKEDLSQIAIRTAVKETDGVELRSLYEPEHSGNAGGKTEEKEKQADILVRLCGEAEYFRNEISEAYAKVPSANHFECLKVKSKKFRLWLTKKYYYE